MINYAEHLGIDLDELETERFTHYRQQKINNQIKIAGAVWANQPIPPKESDWVPIQRAANELHYHTATIRGWTKAGLVDCHKENGRVFVYMPDVIRHAGKR